MNPYRHDWRPITHRPLSPTQRMQVAAVTVALSVLALLVGMCACGGGGLTLTNAAQAADVGAYTAHLHDCVVGSATRSQAVACMAEVDRQFCGSGGVLQVQGGCGEAGADVGMPMGPALDTVLARGIEAGWVTTGSQEAASGVLDAVKGGDR